jgi:hypothetical protein
MALASPRGYFGAGFHRAALKYFILNALLGVLLYGLSLSRVGKLDR